MYYRSGVIGVLIRDPSVPKTLELIEQAEALGMPAVWLTTTGAGVVLITTCAVPGLITTGPETEPTGAVWPSG